MTVTQSQRICLHCHGLFVPINASRSYCCAGCALEHEAAREGRDARKRDRLTYPLPIPSERGGHRKHKMADDEFRAYLEGERQRLLANGLPLVDPTWRTRNVRGMGVEE